MEQLKRKPVDLPQLEITNFTNIFDWTHKDILLKDYVSHNKIDFGDVAV